MLSCFPFGVSPTIFGFEELFSAAASSAFRNDTTLNCKVQAQAYGGSVICARIRSRPDPTG